MFNPRNLRTAERYLIAPPIVAIFGAERVALCDISAGGARLRHSAPLELGFKGELKLLLDGRTTAIVVDAVVVWCQPEAAGVTGYLSGVRLYANEEMMHALLGELRASHRTTRIEELRSTDRFFVVPALKGGFGGRPIYIEDISAHGARIETLQNLPAGTSGSLVFRVPGFDRQFAVPGKVVWSSLKSITGQFTMYRSGIAIGSDPDEMRLAIGLLHDLGNATLDTQSLRLKLRVLRARARAAATSNRKPGDGAVGSEQFLLIEGVRQELRLNPEEAFHWYRRARLSIADPQTRSLTPPISDHPDALAVWEYLDRSVDPSIIGRAFELDAK